MKTIFAFLIAILAVTSSASAQDISFKMKDIAAGSTVTIRNSDGKTFTHQHLGKVNGTYAYRTFAGKSATGLPLETYFTDDRGELTRSVDKNGSITKWKPNRCMRTLGQCRYTRILPDGSKQKRIRVTEATDGGFKYAIYENSGELVLSGWAQLDAFGWSKKGAYKVKGGKTISLKMLASDYR